MNSRFTPEAAKRLNGPITGVAGLGSGRRAVRRGAAVPLGTDLPYHWLHWRCFPAWLANCTYARFGEPQPEQVSAAPTAADTFGESDSLGWQTIRQSKQLAALLAVVLATQIIAAVLDLKA